MNLWDGHIKYMRAKMVILSIGWLLSAALIFFTYAARADVTDTTGATALASDSAVTDTNPAARGVRLPDEPPLVYVMTVDGAIGTVIEDRIRGSINEAEDNGAALLVIKLDTPGGFTQATWKITKAIMNSKVPVCVYIAPSGARAGSAGVYITYAAHFAAMAPSTNIGAAHPVSGSGEQVDSVMNEKITNDAAAQIRAAAAERGRNAEWAERAVRESVSITDREALEMNVINFRAENLDDLLDQINGQVTKLPDGPAVVEVKDADVETISTSLVQRILQVITDPNIALILFSIGSLGIVIELYNPGAILPGVVGAICLILAFYSFSVLPINYAGLALIVIAIIMFIVEIKVVSHGILTVGGLVAFFFGGLILINTHDPDLKVSISLLVTIVALVAAVMALVMYLVVKAHRRQVSVGDKGMIGKSAAVRANDMVYVDGALWRFESSDQVAVGDRVTIVDVQGLKVIVKKLEA